MAKNPQTKNKRRISKWVWVVVGVCVVAGYTFWAVTNQRAKNQEKKDFDQAQVFVDGMKDKIQDKTGPADQVEKRNYCQRSNVGKTEKGPLNCVEAVYLLYLNNDTASSNTLMKQASSLNNAPLRESLDNKVKEFTPDIGMSSRTFYQDYENVGTLSCGGAYSYGFTSFANNLGLIDHNNFQIELSCSGRASKQYFPMER